MNRTIKIISALLIAILLLTIMSNVCLATDYEGIIKDVDGKADSSTVDTSELNEKAGNIVKAIRNIAAVASVVILSILGIKYMIGSTAERAEYKKSFIPLIVGIVVVVAAASIASALFGVAG